MKSTFREITSNIDMVLFNAVTSVDYELELEAGDDMCQDIFQYFAINRGDGEYISRVTGMPLYYSSKCDLYVLGVDFLDNWENLSYEI